jgi:hypothetical protein
MNTLQIVEMKQTCIKNTVDCYVLGITNGDIVGMTWCNCGHREIVDIEFMNSEHADTIRTKI